MARRSGYAVLAEGLVKRYTTWIRRGFLKREKRVVEALKGVSFSVAWGEVFGLLGPNGAGKTTTVKILSTLLLPDGGRAEVNGYDVVREPLRVRESTGVVLSVERGFFWKLTGRENLRYFGMLRGLRGRRLEERVEELLELVGLKELGGADKLYEEYSLGMKARLALARALLHDPPVLILDEPTLGLDPPSARTVRELLVKMARDAGKAVIVTTHNMFEAEMICNRVAIIDRGVIVAQGPPAELKRIVSREVPVVVKFGGRPQAAPEEVERRLSQELGSSRLRVELEGDGYRARVLVDAGEEERAVAKLVWALSSMGFAVLRVEVQEPSLEDVFIAVTRGW
ncbi:MAG: ABC transporter ATP-binding protein [Thermoproteota archaeon]